MSDKTKYMWTADGEHLKAVVNDENGNKADEVLIAVLPKTFVINPTEMQVLLAQANLAAELGKKVDELTARLAETEKLPTADGEILEKVRKVVRSLREHYDEVKETADNASENISNVKSDIEDLSSRVSEADDDAGEVVSKLENDLWEDIDDLRTILGEDED